MATPSPSNLRLPGQIPKGMDWGFLEDERLSWVCCYCSSQWPISVASFDMLLTTCQHIVRSSCWDTSCGLSGECQCCRAHALPLNLMTTRPLPKQLFPYFKSPVELLTSILSDCRFQEHQRQQCLAQRKKANAFLVQDFHNLSQSVFLYSALGAISCMQHVPSHNLPWRASGLVTSGRFVRRLDLCRSVVWVEQ